MPYTPQTGLQMPLDRCTRMADIFKALGDINRLRLIRALLEGERCSSHLVALLGMEPSAISHQVRLLRHLGIISSRKEGKHIYHQLSNECVRRLLDLVEEHLSGCCH